MNNLGETAIEASGRAAITRRQIIWLGGLTSVLTAISPNFAKAAEFLFPEEPTSNVSEIMRQLSAYMSAAATRPLPEDVNEKAKQHILDAFAAMISGSGLVPGRAALEFARAYGGKAVATVVASNIVCGPIEAAFANGVLAHSDETDDSHGPSRSHPGVSTVPAGFASGEQ
ncbi:MAG TPA: MmgE/PrpD family protein, partial [Candidatus Eremiobacteraceae bacterium]|nr:MmgE/PrpD family protein [Candidatus Eremiobacteraceae bacterium]